MWISVLFFFLSFFFIGCGHAPLKGKQVVGADEFVTDSYQIRQGKFAILEMTGHPQEQFPIPEGNLSQGGKIFLMGLVETPTLEVRDNLKLFEALSLAQVPPRANLFRSYVARDDKILPVDLHKLVKEGDMSQNISLQGGDKIYIADAAASNVMVMGEVKKPVVVPMLSGSLTLKQALAEADGIPFTGDKSYIQVIRGSLQNPKIYTLNWKHIMKLPSDSLLLIPGDVVYVATTPLGEWSNFVSQILPTIIGAEIIQRDGKNLGVSVQGN